MRSMTLVLIAVFLIGSITYGDNNLVPNGGFEDWTSGDADSWHPDTNAVDSGYPQQESTDVYAGNYSAEWQWNKSDNGANINDMSKSDMFPLVVGAKDRLQATFKPLSHNIGNGEIEILMGVADSTTGEWKMWLQDTNGNTAKLLLYWGSFDTNVVVGSDYTTKNIDFTVPALVPNRSGRLYMLNRYWRGGRILLDDVRVAPVPPSGTLIIIK